MNESESKVSAPAVPWYKEDLFPGRLNRGNYAIGLILFAFSIAALLMGFAFLIDPLPRSHENPTPLQIILILLIALPFQAIYVLGIMSLMVRRLHDFNEGNEYKLHFFFDWKLLLTPGTQGPNNFGEVQKGYGLRQIIGLK